MGAPCEAGGGRHSRREGLVLQGHWHPWKQQLKSWERSDPDTELKQCAWADARGSPYRPGPPVSKCGQLRLKSQRSARRHLLIQGRCAVARPSVTGSTLESWVLISPRNLAAGPGLGGRWPRHQGRSEDKRGVLPGGAGRRRLCVCLTMLQPLP